MPNNGGSIKCCYWRCAYIACRPGSETSITGQSCRQVFVCDTLCWSWERGRPHSCLRCQSTVFLCDIKVKNVAVAVQSQLLCLLGSLNRLIWCFLFTLIVALTTVLRTTVLYCIISTATWW